MQTFTLILRNVASAAVALTLVSAAAPRAAAAPLADGATASVVEDIAGRSTELVPLDPPIKGKMVRLPAGELRSLYGSTTDSTANRVRVESFRLDVDAVTRGEFVDFVRAHPEWRRSRVRGVHADRMTYLRDWRNDLEAGGAMDAPVIWVSWSAARAYCKAQDKRLPTVAEWEYAAAASANRRDATRDAAFIQDLMEVYARRGLPLRPVPEKNAWGVRGLHELVWEWVEDFNSVLVSDDSRGVGARDFGQVCASAAIGAADASNYPAFLRFAVRAGLEGRTSMGSLGFRCAI